jgi:hypothetical protein
VQIPHGATLLLMIAGFVVWSSAFLALYAVLTVGCALNWNEPDSAPGVHRLVLLAVWFVHIAAIVLLAWGTKILARDRPGSKTVSGFLLAATWGSTLAALGATAWIGIPIFMTSTCV